MAKKKVDKEESLKSAAAPENNIQEPITKESLANLSDEELKELHVQKNKEAEEKTKELQTKFYSVKVDDAKNIKDLAKLYKDNAKWNTQSAAITYNVYENIKRIKETKEDGTIELKMFEIHSLYQFLLGYEGKGVFEAKAFATLLTNLGKPFSDAMTAVQEDNQKVRDIHTLLTDIDTESEARKNAQKQGVNIDRSAPVEAEAEVTEAEEV